MSTIVTIVVDVALTTSWWIVRKTTYGIYSGITYLIWGPIDTQDDKQRKQLMDQMEYQKKLLVEMKYMIANGKCDNLDDDDLPPSYQEITEEDTQDIQYNILHNEKILNT